MNGLPLTGGLVKAFLGGENRVGKLEKTKQNRVCLRLHDGEIEK